MTQGFRFVEDPHGYFLGTEELPSPSSVFADLGLVDPRFYTADSRARGRAAHAWMAEALAGRSYAGADEEIKRFVESGLRFVERRKPTILRLETSLHHPMLRFAGTFDAEWALEGWQWIVDWKTGKAHWVAPYQTAAYEMLARVANPLFRRWKRAVFELQADGSEANFTPHQDHTDGAAWLNLLGAYRIRQGRRVQKLAPIE